MVPNPGERKVNLCQLDQSICMTARHLRQELESPENLPQNCKRGEFIATLHGGRALIGTAAAISSNGKLWCECELKLTPEEPLKTIIAALTILR